MAWTIRDPRFEIEQVNWLKAAEEENRRAAGGFRWLEPTDEDRARETLEASVFGWRLYNNGEVVAWSLGELLLPTCQSMLEWLNQPVDLEVKEMWDWNNNDRTVSSTKEWFPLEPFFEVHLSHPSAYRKTPTAQWLLVNGGEYVAASDPDFFDHQCRDFLAWIQGETEIPIVQPRNGG